MNERAARSLTKRIQKGYRDLEELLIEAIVHNVWVPLGYDSFTAWYDAELGAIPLARGARNLVVITMFAEKSTVKITDADIAEIIGVSPSAVKEVRRSWNAGLLPGFVPPLESGRKRPERRRWTKQFRWMGVRVKIELHDELQQWGRANHKPLREIQEEALELYANLNVRQGVEPTPEERKPNTSARRARSPKFQPPQ